MKKTIFLVLAALLLVCASAGCITAGDSNGVLDKPITLTSPVNVYTDSETGIEYFVIYTSYGVEMTPRYNADGTLRINEEFRK